MANISNFIAKGRDLVGTANVLKDFLPDSVKKPLDEFINGTRPTGNAQKGLNKILSTVNGINGVARPNHFYVTITPPKSMQAPSVSGSNITIPSQIPFLVESAQLPGVMIATSSIRRYGYGPEEKKPYGATFVDVNMTFVGDGDYNVHRFFYAWLNRVVIFAKGPTEKNAFEVSYKSDYATDIQITTLDETGRTVTVVTLVGAYPIFLGDVGLNWSDTDSYVRIPVGFTYQYWKREVINLDDPAAKAAEPGILQKLMGAASAIQVLSSIRRPRNAAEIINVVGNSTRAIGGLRGLF
jgi:hypothetical protein